EGDVMRRLRLGRVWALTPLVALAALAAGGLPLQQQTDEPRPEAPQHAGTDGPKETDLRQAVDRFIAAAHRAEAEAGAAAYDPDFTCVRVADEGGFARLPREQMLQFFSRAGDRAGGGHSIPTKGTTVHHVEVIGDTGYVLLTRTK